MCLIFYFQSQFTPFPQNFTYSAPLKQIKNVLPIDLLIWSEFVHFQIIAVEYGSKLSVNRSHLEFMLA